MRKRRSWISLRIAYRVWALCLGLFAVVIQRPVVQSLRIGDALRMRGRCKSFGKLHHGVGERLGDDGVLLRTHVHALVGCLCPVSCSGRGVRVRRSPHSARRCVDSMLHSGPCNWRTPLLLRPRRRLLSRIEPRRPSRVPYLLRSSLLHGLGRSEFLDCMRGRYRGCGAGHSRILLRAARRCGCGCEQGVAIAASGRVLASDTTA